MSALAGAVLCLCCLSCGPLSSRIVYDSRPSVERLKLGETTLETEVDGLAKPLIESKEATCLEVGVMLADGSTHFFGYGRVGDTGLPVLPDKNTIFQVGSISKLFTASELELLVQKGEIKYSDTIRSILPVSSELSPDMGQVSVYELATHTSGLPREPVTLKQFMFFIDYEFTGRNLYRYMDEPWLSEYLKTTKIRNKSHKFIYSNIGYGLLAHLVAVKMGRPFQDLVTQELFSPLRMGDTTYSLSPEQKAREATGHVGDQPYFMKRNTPMKPWNMGEVMAPSGGVYSTAADLLTYARASLAGDPGLGPILLETTEPKVKQENGEMSALGWEISQKGPTRITYKHGMASGYSAYLGMVMARKIAVVVLCSSFNWNDKIGHNLLLRLAGSQDE